MIIRNIRENYFFVLFKFSPSILQNIVFSCYDFLIFIVNQNILYIYPYSEVLGSLYVCVYVCMQFFFYLKTYILTLHIQS